MTPDPAPPAVLRVRSPGLRQAVVVLVLSVLATTGAALDHQAVAAPLLAVLTLLVVGLVIQTAVAQIRATADGLTSRSPWRRPRRLTWAEVDGFAVRGFWRVLGAWTVDGRWVALMPHAAFEPLAYHSRNRLEMYRRGLRPDSADRPFGRRGL